MTRCSVFRIYLLLYRLIAYYDLQCTGGRWPENRLSEYNVCFSLVPRPPSSFCSLVCIQYTYVFVFLASAAAGGRGVGGEGRSGGGGGGGGGGRRVESAPPHRMIGLATPISQFRTPLSGGGRGRAMPMSSRLACSVPRKMS